MAKCARCGAEQSAQTVFCVSCGAQRVATTDAPLVGTDRSLLIVTAFGKLVALSAPTGEIVWQREIDAGTPDLVIQSGRVFVAVGQSLYVCDYATGRPDWRAETTAWTERPALVVEGDLIYVCSAGEVDCFDAKGSKLWTRKLWSALGTSPAMGFPGNVTKPDQT